MISKSKRTDSRASSMIRVYNYLLKDGPATPSKISKNTGIHLYSAQSCLWYLSYFSLIETLSDGRTMIAMVSKRGANEKYTGTTE